MISHEKDGLPPYLQKSIDGWLAGNDDRKKQALEECIPEFARHNIIEAAVRDVC